MAELLQGIELIKKNGSKEKAEHVCKDKLIGLYFSARGCQPCREFTPQLKDFYDNIIKKNNLAMEIIFVTFDGKAETFENYFKNDHGDWYAIPFGHEKNEELENKYSVTGIPKLVVIKADGTVIDSDGRDKLDRMTTFEEWEEKLK